MSDSDGSEVHTEGGHPDDSMRFDFHGYESSVHEVESTAQSRAHSPRPSGGSELRQFAAAPGTDHADEFQRGLAALRQGSSLPRLPSDVRDQVSSLLRALAGKYVSDASLSRPQGGTGASPSSAGGSLASPRPTGASSSTSHRGAAWDRDPSATSTPARTVSEVLDESRRAEDALGGGLGGGAAPDGGRTVGSFRRLQSFKAEATDDSMAAYARWLKGALDPADEGGAPGEGAAARAGDDAADPVDFTHAGFGAGEGVSVGAGGAFRAYAAVMARNEPARASTAAPPSMKRRPSTLRKKSMTNRPPARVSVSIRCACVVGKEVWAVARDTGSIVVHDAVSAGVLHTILCMHNLILTMAAVPGRRSLTVWCGTEAGTVLLFDAATRTQLREAPRQHAGAVQCIAMQAAASSGGAPSGPALVVSGGSDRRLCVWGEDGSFKKAYAGHTAAVRTALILGAHIWSGSDDGTVRVWDLAHAIFHLAQSEACIAVLRNEAGAGGSVRALMSTGPSYVLSASEDGWVCKWQSSGAFSCVLRVRCAGQPSSLVAMGRRLWVCCGKAGIEVRDALSLDLTETLRTAPPHAPPGTEIRGGAVGALRVAAIERRTAWTWVPGEPAGQVWEREETEAKLSVDEYAAALAEAEAARAQVDANFERLAALKHEARTSALRALAVKAALAHELECALELGADKMREIDRITRDALRQQAADLEEQAQLQRLCEQLEATMRRQDAGHARELAEASEREAALRRELDRARGDGDRLRADLEKAQRQASAAFCERDLLRLQSSSLKLELDETRTEVTTLRRHSASVADLEHSDGAAEEEEGGGSANSTPRATRGGGARHVLGVPPLAARAPTTPENCVQLPLPSALQGAGDFQPRPQTMPRGLSRGASLDRAE